MKNVLRKILGVKPQIIDTTQPEIRLDDWRKNSNLVNESGKIQRTPIFRAMLGLLKLESPANYAPFSPRDENVVARACYAAKIEGYNLCLNNLEALGRHPERIDNHLIATFEAEKTTEKDQES